MSNALIYSPGLEGHRQVYVFVLTKILKELNYNVLIACNKNQRILNSYYFDKIKNDTTIILIDTGRFQDGGLKIKPNEFDEIQENYNIDITIFAEADHHISLFNSQIPKSKYRFKCKLIGIFLRPFYFYKRLTFIDKLKYLKHLPSNWRSDNRLFHEFLLRRFSLLDKALYLDENFVQRHSNTYWLPDVFQEYADLLIQETRPDQRVWMAKLKDFLEKRTNKFRILYFGTAQYRRGYDILLKMADELNCCFIHCGLTNENEHFDYNIIELKKSLSHKGLLFETNQFIEDSECIEFFFRSITHIVIPYRNFFGSSGIMLQALRFKIPVLAPENGIMGFRIKKYNLGMTYDSNDLKSLRKQFNIFKEIDPKEFTNNIANYMRFQTPERLKSCLVKTINGTREDIQYP